VVTTGIDTLAEEAGREGFRIRDGPASSKLTHSIEELWEPAHQLLPGLDGNPAYQSKGYLRIGYPKPKSRYRQRCNHKGE